MAIKIGLSVAFGVAAFASGVVLTLPTGGIGALGIAAAFDGGGLSGDGTQVDYLSLVF